MVRIDQLRAVVLTGLLSLVFALPACGDGELGGDGLAPIDASDQDLLVSPDVEFGDSGSGDAAGDVGCVDGTACDDGDPCTIDDVCDAGLCVGGVNRVCDEEGPCRVGVCDATAGGCVYSDETDGAECSVSCFGQAACSGGSCQVVAESAVVCPSPDSPCVEALGCDSSTGDCTVEIYRPAGVTCDSDDDVCSLETCDGTGICESTGAYDQCAAENTQNPCWTYLCNAKSGCALTNFVYGASCDDNSPCTSNDTCTDNEFGQKTCLGTPIPIDDGNPCTDDTCIAGTIAHTPLDGAVCVSDSPCSESGTCDDTLCVPSTPCECSQNADCPQPESLCDGVAVCDTSGQTPACIIIADSVVTCGPPLETCHSNTCNPVTGLCDELPVADGAPCTDNSACTGGDACLAGACAGGPAVACDDGLFCNGQETCAPESGCQPGPPLILTDELACTTDSCDEESDQPTHTPNDALCDNGLYCDGQEVCGLILGCQSGLPLTVSDDVDCTVDSCDEASDTVIHSTDDALCSDGLFCNGAESCDAAQGCQSTDPPQLDDAVSCTTDSCDDVLDQILHTPVDALCDDTNACTADICDALDGCTYPPTDAPCSDDDPCTGQDTCLNGACQGQPILSEGLVCNNVDDDCDGETDENCTFGVAGYVMGGGAAVGADASGQTIDGASGVRRFIGATTDGNYTVLSGLPPQGEP